jgi:transposase
MSEQPTIHTERVDDVPLLLAHMERLGLVEILDGHFPAHGNHRGLSLGLICLVWLAHILSRADHRLNRVRGWAEQLQTTLTTVLPVPLRPTDLTDDRLADVLHALSDDAAWAECESALNQRILRVYDLSPSTVRVDGTTASGYWEVTDDGLFQFGHSKDHRPDQPQVKVMLATLDPLGLPLAVDVLPGQRSDDRLYLPIIARVRASLGRRGLLYVGDSKLGAVGTRAHIHHDGDYYLCPLGRVQLSADHLAALVEMALAGPPLVPILRPTADGVLLVDDDGNPVACADAWETTSEVTAEVEGVPITWTERRVLVRSRRMQAAQGQALERRLQHAETELAELLASRRGKTCPSTPAEAETAIAAILERHQVGGLLSVTLTAEAQTRTIRAYRGQPAREETRYRMRVDSVRNEAALAAARERLGWQVYVTNRPAEQFSLSQVVLAYREQYLVEHPIGRLKGAPLSLSPVYLSRDDHVTGLVRLLTLGVRALCALEYGIRQNLAQEPSEPPLKGLYAGQPTRSTRRPTAERVLEAFRDLTLTVVALPNQFIRHLTPLSALQQRLLALAGLEATCYLRLVEHSSEPPG